MTDDSNGYESIAAAYIKVRGRAVDGIGSSTVRAWARSLPKGSAVLDVGCGTGIPVTNILLEEGLTAYALDASPTMTETFRKNFPEVPVACEPVEHSPFFHRSFDGIIAVGLVFLLPEATQRALISQITGALHPGGRFLFTAPADKIEWKDVMTGQLSRSLGAEEYKALLSASGLSIVDELEDEGENHYYDAIRLNQG